MEYSFTLQIDEKKIDINVVNDSDKQKEQAKRLLAYYSMFLKSNIDTSGNEKKEKLLDRIITSLSDEGVIDMVSKLQDEQGRSQVIQIVEEILDAYEEDDFEDYVDVELNGNVFTYYKTLEIDKYYDTLFAIGEELKGKKWRVELDEEGKVVLCE